MEEGRQKKANNTQFCPSYFAHIVSQFEKYGSVLDHPRLSTFQKITEPEWRDIRLNVSYFL